MVVKINLPTATYNKILDLLYENIKKILPKAMIPDISSTSGNPIMLSQGWIDPSQIIPVTTTNTWTNTTAGSAYTTNWSKPNPICQGCGNTFHDFEDSRDKLTLCARCRNAFNESMWHLFYDIAYKGKTQYCDDCKKHLNACKCEKSEAMRQIKK